MAKLTKNERIELEQELRREDVRKYADRIRVILLLDQGWTHEMIATALFLDKSTTHRYKKSYEEGGLEQLITDGYYGRRAMLSKDQQIELAAELTATPRLSIKEIISFVEGRFGILYTVSGLTDALHRLGFSYKKPKRIPAKADADQQELFINNLEILRENKKDDELIYFADSSHPELNSMPQYGWFPKGEPQTLLTNSGRQRHNLIGAVDIDNLQSVVRSYDTINAGSVLGLIKALEQKHHDISKIYLIVDNARYFHSVKVREYLEDNSQVKLIFLPPYSPNLNPIERLWKFMHKKVLYNKYYSSCLEFRQKITTFFRNISIYADELRTLLTYNFEEIKN